MKKLVVVLLAVCALCGFGACQEEDPKETYTIYFEQDGQNTIEKKVQEGDVLTDVPMPAPVEGYDVAWNLNDFSKVDRDTVITAVLTPKTYTLVFDAGQGTPNLESQKVVYEQSYTLAKATWGDYIFDCWEYNGQKVDTFGIWKYDGITTLTAKWKCSVVFRSGEEILKEVVVDYGAEFPTEQMPDLPTEDGYTFQWSEREDTVENAKVFVDAVKTANVYKLYYDYDFSGSVPQNLIYDNVQKMYYQEIVFGESYTLVELAARADAFAAWETLDGKLILASGIYQNAGDNVLKIRWIPFADDEFWSENV